MQARYRASLGSVSFGETDADGNFWNLEEIEGWLSPGSSGQVTQRTARDGGWRSKAYRTPRGLTLRGQIFTVRDNVGDVVDRLLDCIPLDTPGALTVYGVTGDDRLMYVRQEGDPDIAIQTPNMASFSIGLVAPDGMKYGAVQRVSSTNLPSSIGGLTVPFSIAGGTVAHWWVSGPLNLDGWTAPDYSNIPTARLHVGDRFVYPGSHDKFTWDGTTWNYDGTAGSDGTAGQMIILSPGAGLSINSVTVSGFATVENQGTAAAYPRIIVYGPVTDARLTLIETGEFMMINLDLADGEYIDLDFANHTAYLNGNASRRGYVSGAWFSLPPGLSSVAFNSPTYSATASAQIIWRDAWK